MFTCKACTRRVLASLVNATLRLEKTSVPPRLVNATSQPREQKGRKGYSTAAASAETAKKDVLRNGQESSRRVSPQEWAARKQLQYLKDPLHIADYVRKTLAKGNFEEAAMVTRNASKDMKVTVSWNHLIDHQLQHDRLHAAIKLYNEMKKRSQLPNAQTFTIIFRGCATSSHPKLAVSEAVRIYDAMLSKDRIPPNTIHMNAVLQVCAKAEDLDSLFSIANTANDGLRAPNSLTYTTILNALRSKVNKPHDRSVDAEGNEDAKKQVVQRAKSIWEEVITKWRAGSLIIDEELVCAMGRILLMGDYHDANAVAALLEQTMMIPQGSRVAIPGSSPETAGLEGIKTYSEPALTIDNHKIKAPGAPAAAYALPGNNSLSMILSAIEKTGKTTKSQLYWDIFTKQFGVVPDANNWHQLFTALRRGKNSAQAASYLREMPTELMVPKNFRIAMSTCMRDNLNRSAFNHATDILKLMLIKLKSPDILTSRTYLRVAYSNKQYFLKKSKHDYEAAMREWGQQLAAAIDNVSKPYMMAYRECENDGPESNRKQEVVALARKMIAACDRVISSKTVSPEMEGKMILNRNSLNRVVVRHFEQMEKVNPNFRQDKEEDANFEHDEDSFDVFAKQFQQKPDRRAMRPRD
ncbi:hypothetical protein GGS26DRAFT_548811 [Hypomontagnella submonticulosa]|nr:hypothetical protein GGS26DRAFT_548811 [Hypomontagnella submonticulosa]